MQALSRFFSFVMLVGCSPTDENVLPQGTPKTPVFSNIPQPLALSVLPERAVRPPSASAPKYTPLVLELAAQFNANTVLPLDRFFAPEVSVYNVGATRQAHVQGLVALTEHMKAMLESYERLEMHPVRLMESGDAVIFEYTSVITATLPNKPRKIVRLPAAMVFVFNQERKITEMWSFQNELFNLQELGMLPEPVSYVPFQPNLEQPVRIIAGEARPELAVTHQQFRQFLTAIHKDIQLPQLVSSDFKGLGPQRPVEITYADLQTYTSLRQMTFPDLNARIERDFLAGNFHAALVTYEGTFQGSSKVSPAKVITFTALEVMGVNADGLIDSWSNYVNPLQLYRQMGLYNAEMAQTIQDTIRPNPPPATQTLHDTHELEPLAAFPESSVGLEVCDKMLTHLRQCASSMDVNLRREYLLSLSAAHPSWRLLARGNATQREALTKNCQALYAQLRVHFKATCPYTP